MKNRLHRNLDDSIIGGVCSGISERFEMDPTILRLIWGVLILCYGTGLIAYLILWAIMAGYEEDDI